MSDVYLVRFLADNGHTLEGYYYGEKEARAVHADALKTLDKALKKDANSAPFTFTDEFGITITVNLLTCTAVIITNTDASAKARQNVEAANRDAHTRYGGVVAGFQPGTLIATPSQ